MQNQNNQSLFCNYHQKQIVLFCPRIQCTQRRLICAICITQPNIVIHLNIHRQILPLDEFFKFSEQQVQKSDEKINFEVNDLKNLEEKFYCAARQKFENIYNFKMLELQQQYKILRNWQQYFKQSSNVQKLISFPTIEEIFHIFSCDPQNIQKNFKQLKEKIYKLQDSYCFLQTYLERCSQFYLQNINQFKNNLPSIKYINIQQQFSFQSAFQSEQYIDLVIDSQQKLDTWQTYMINPHTRLVINAEQNVLSLNEKNLCKISRFAVQSVTFDLKKLDIKKLKYFIIPQSCNSYCFNLNGIELNKQFLQKIKKAFEEVHRQNNFQNRKSMELCMLLENTNITEECISVVFEIINLLSPVNLTLDLSRNMLTQSEISALSNLFKLKKNLKKFELSLQQCNINSELFKILNKGILENSSLQYLTLNLMYTKINEYEFYNLQKLKNLNKLVLFLDQAIMRDKSVKLLITSLKKMNLNQIKITGLQMGNQTYEKFERLATKKNINISLTSSVFAKPMSMFIK